MDQREAPHLLDTVARLEGMGVSARLPKKSKLRRNTPPAIFLRLHRLPDLPIYSGTELQERSSRLPSREQPPSCSAAAPARPLRAGIFNYFLPEKKLGVNLGWVGLKVESNRADSRLCRVLGRNSGHLSHEYGKV